MHTLVGHWYHTQGAVIMVININSGNLPANDRRMYGTTSSDLTAIYTNGIYPEVIIDQAHIPRLYVSYRPGSQMSRLQGRLLWIINRGGPTSLS